MATMLLGRNDKTPSTVTRTTCGAVQTQLPFYIVRELIFMIVVVGCVFLLTAAVTLVPFPLVPASMWVSVCAFIYVWANVPKVKSTLTLWQKRRSIKNKQIETYRASLHFRTSRLYSTGGTFANIKHGTQLPLNENNIFNSQVCKVLITRNVI